MTKLKARACCVLEAVEGLASPLSCLRALMVDLFTSLNLRKRVIYVCMCVHRCTVRMHTAVYCKSLLSLHVDLQHTRKYVLSLPHIPFLNYIVTQIGSVTNFKLEVLKIRSVIQLVKCVDMCWAPNYWFYNYQRAELHITAGCYYLYCCVTTGLMKRIGGGNSTENVHSVETHRNRRARQQWVLVAALE